MAKSKDTPKGIYVGTFSEKDIAAGKDKRATEKAIAKTGLKYTNVRIRNHKFMVWVCSAEDFEV